MGELTLCKKGGEHHLIIAFYQSVASSANVVVFTWCCFIFFYPLVRCCLGFVAILSTFVSSQRNRISVYRSVYRSVMLAEGLGYNIERSSVLSVGALIVFHQMT